MHEIMNGREMRIWMAYNGQNFLGRRTSQTERELHFGRNDSLIVIFQPYIYTRGRNAYLMGLESGARIPMNDAAMQAAREMNLASGGSTSYAIVHYRPTTDFGLVVHLSDKGHSWPDSIEQILIQRKFHIE